MRGAGGRSVLRESVQRELLVEQALTANELFTVVPYTDETPAAVCIASDCRAEAFNHMFLSVRKPGEVYCDRCGLKGREAGLKQPHPVYRRYTVAQLEQWRAAFETHYFAS